MTGMIDNDFGMKCGQCGASDEIDIAATVWIRLCRGGTDATAAANGDHEWNEHSVSACGACGHHGKAAEFSKAGRQ